MGDDLISRQAAIDALEKKKDKKSQGDISSFYNKIIQNDIDTLMLLPTADRPQGEWIEVDDYFIRCKCSICGWESHKYEDDVYGMSYCPNCGAKMSK